VAAFDVSRLGGFATFGGVGFLPITSANEINFNCFGKESDLNTTVGGKTHKILDETGDSQRINFDIWGRCAKADKLNPRLTKN
jgi:hypothetical protein